MIILTFIYYDAQTQLLCQSQRDEVHMAKPDLPNFSIGGRIVFGVIVIVVIAALLRFLGYL
jgi:hypothetical protein